MTNIAILASGSGSNAESIIQYFKGHPEIRVSLILSNREDAYVLERARNNDIPCATFNRSEFREGLVLRDLLEKNIDIIVLAGFLWLLPADYIRQFPVLNIHPSLLPKYGGKGLYGMHVHRAVRQSGDEETGMTIHRVDERYDEGPILFQEKCPVRPEDTAEDIAARVLKLEHKNYPRVIEEFIQNSDKK